MNGFGWFFLGWALGAMVMGIAAMRIIAQDDWEYEPDDGDGEPRPEEEPQTPLRVVA